MHVLDYHDTAQYADGDADPARSGREAMRLYSQNAGPVASPMGVRPVAWFDVEVVVQGRADWDEVRINSFPSHATFDALTSNVTWQSGRHHRSAALNETYAIRTSPLINLLGQS